MKLSKLTGLSLAVGSVMYLTACQSLPHSTKAATAQSDLPKNTEIQYPHTRTVDDKQDIFKSGEMGRPTGLVGTNIDTRNKMTSDIRSKPDTGVTRMFDGYDKDKYRWLEEMDQISPLYLKETTTDRQRNFIGTRQENDTPNGQLDDRTKQALQTVPENRPKSEVTAWVDAQNATTQAYLQKMPVLQGVLDNANSLYFYEHTIRKVKKPNLGELHLFRGTDGYQRIVLTDNDGNKKELWRETDLENGLRNATGDFYVSKDGTYFALFLVTGGSDSDITTLHIFDSRTGKQVGKPVSVGDFKDVPYFGAIWVDDTNLLYNRVKRLSSDGIYRHTVGKDKFNDKIEVGIRQLDVGIFGVPWLTGKDNRYLIVPAPNGGITDNLFFIKDLQTGKMYRPFDKKVIDKKRTTPYYFIAGVFVHLDDETGDVYLISGEHDDQKGEIVKTNLHNLKKREVLVPVNPDYEDIIDATYHAEGPGYFAIKYRKDGQHRIVITDMHGKILKDITPATTGYADNLFSHIVGETSASNKSATNSDSQALDENYVTFRFQNFGLPRTVYKYSISQDKFIDIRRRDLYPFDESQYTSELVHYQSKDGTVIPMSITYKKGMVKNGKNPLMMQSYGGFAVPNKTQFSTKVAVWLENGGMFAQPHIRGGDEYGNDWHTAGNLENKMNVFDDFAAAADYLHEKGYSSPEYTMISGGSNGGLLVGASMVLHPEKFRVALPHAGVMDMYRQDSKYYVGTWAFEFGTAQENRKIYEVLKSYTPYQNVKAGVCYPSAFITTAKRDDRVLPFHSYKFAAALQEYQSCNRPTLLAVDENAGHNPRTPRQIIEHSGWGLAFALNEMGIKSVAPATRPTIEQLKGEKWLKEEAEANKK